MNINTVAESLCLQVFQPLSLKGVSRPEQAEQSPPVHRAGQVQSAIEPSSPSTPHDFETVISDAEPGRIEDPSTVEETAAQETIVVNLDSILYKSTPGRLSFFKELRIEVNTFHNGILILTLGLCGFTSALSDRIKPDKQPNFYGGQLCQNCRVRVWSAPTLC